jgi:hypothetical protein
MATVAYLTCVEPVNPDKPSYFPMPYGISRDLIGLCPQRLISTVELTSILPSLTGAGEGEKA